MATDTALSDQELQELRELLLRLREENEADLRRAREALSDLSSSQLLVDPAMREVGTNAEYLIDDATAILAKIDAAQARMTAGSYGTCTGCGNAIPIGRLRVRPYQPTCVACAR